MNEPKNVETPKVPPVVLQRNPVTHQHHRRDVLRQVTIPLIAGTVVILTLSILVVWGSATGEHARWAGISLIWLIMPTLLFAFIILALLVGLIYLVTIMFIRLPLFARKVQDFFLLIKYQIAQLDNKMVDPFLRFHSFKASMRTLGRNLRPKR
jgi:hypothetical protein